MKQAFNSLIEICAADAVNKLADITALGLASNLHNSLLASSNLHDINVTQEQGLLRRY